MRVGIITELDVLRVDIYRNIIKDFKKRKTFAKLKNEGNNSRRNHLLSNGHKVISCQVSFAFFFFFFLLLVMADDDGSKSVTGNI